MLDEQEDTGVFRQILQFHNVGRMQLAQEMEGTVAFPGIPPRSHWQGRPQRAHL